MKVLNDVNRKGGFPITTEVLEVLDNASMLRSIIKSLLVSGIKGAWTFLDWGRKTLVWINHVGDVDIFYCENDMMEIVLILSGINANRKKYYLSPNYSYMSISNKDGSKEYEDAILENRARIVEVTGDMAPLTYYTIDELLHEKIYERLESMEAYGNISLSTQFVNSVSSNYVTKDTNSMCRVNKGLRRADFQLYLNHNYSIQAPLRISLSSSMLSQLSVGKFSSSSIIPLTAITKYHSGDIYNLVPAYLYTVPAFNGGFDFWLVINFSAEVVGTISTFVSGTVSF
jgi:hypothetical protein